MNVTYEQSKSNQEDINNLNRSALVPGRGDGSDELVESS